MTEGRIKELAKKCSKKLNDLSDGIQDDEIIVLEYFRTVAAEAREEGLEEGRDIAIAAFETDIDSTVWDLNRIRVFIREAIAERLKADGKR